MRGKRTGCSVASWPVRIIPAHAGQTCTPRTSCDFPQDHPRACGANACMTGVIDNVDGSSPRMRGKHIQTNLLSNSLRIIPAHAGQTYLRTDCRNRMSDHPRACGANCSNALHHYVRLGSSPRMRGKRAAPRSCMGAARIIPAHAGQTQFGVGNRVCRTDHPRACGANTAGPFIPNLLLGSSPRMRGKLLGERGLERVGRIIPAHAGQTCVVLCVFYHCSDHPRACGANQRLGHDIIASHGSSPRMRGKRDSLAAAGFAVRIIPAHAGQTVSSAPSVDIDADHPRACGANSPFGLVYAAVAGSSPRMRGKRNAW